MIKPVFYPHQHVSVEKMNNLLSAADTQDFKILHELQACVPIFTEESRITILTDTESISGLNENNCETLQVLDLIQSHTKLVSDGYIPSDSGFIPIEYSMNVYVVPGAMYTTDYSISLPSIVSLTEGGASSGELWPDNIEYTVTEVPSGSPSRYYTRIDLLCLKYKTTDTDIQAITFLDPNLNIYQERRVTQRTDDYEIVIVQGDQSSAPGVIEPEEPTIPPDYFPLAKLWMKNGTVRMQGAAYDDALASEQTTGYIEDYRDLHLFYNSEVGDIRVQDANITITDAGDGKTFYTPTKAILSTMEVYIGGLRKFMSNNDFTVENVTVGDIEQCEIVLSVSRGSDQVNVSYRINYR